MSIRIVLIGGMLVITAATTFMIGALGVYSISQSVENEAQTRVTHDLGIVSVYLQNHIEVLAQSIEETAATISITESDITRKIGTLRQELDLDVLNLCDVNGRGIAGTYPDFEITVPVIQDPVLRKALKGKTAWGMTALDSSRLDIEGGAALQKAVIVYSKGSKNEIASQVGFFLWVASPLFDDKGRVIALLYGGRLLNYNFDLIDNLRDKIFTSDLYNGKPLGTVTIFLGGLRVATNVLGPDGKRAVGTFVSKEVQKAVLEENQNYLGRAWVVDQWYLSGYQPIHDPDGHTIGILYVGLLEEPYKDLRTRLISRFLVPTALVVLVAFGAAFLVVNRIIGPLQTLRDAASRLAVRDWQEDITIPRTYSEIVELTSVFRGMQQAIKTRDHQLTAQNQQLTVTNEQLETTNRNYMQTLGFVTHELKSPLAAMQSMVSLVVDGYVGEVSDKVREPLVRIKRNCEELQDMVKNYLDLSRAERGELAAKKSHIHYHQEVVEPCVEQTQALFNSRGVTLTVTSPKDLVVQADPELMRIALTNYLTNAAKYGAENKTARLTVNVEQEVLTGTVWNEGVGFTAEEKESLFKKFSRLKNPNTANKRGSGLGLFLVERILELHDGKVWAESNPGQWAEFSFCFPIESCSPR